MALFNVVGECVVDGKHYPGPHPAPVEVDEAVAGPLVEAGQLTPVESAEPEPEQPSGDTPTVSPEGEQVPDGEAAQPRRPGRGRGEE
jgi:hypothetical protein